MRLSKKILHDPQLLFEYVVEKLWKQEKKAVDKSTLCCFYRAKIDSKTVRCAVGWCIPDSVYTKDLEGVPASDLFEKSHLFTEKVIKWVNSISEDCQSLLVGLQQVHDDFIEVDQNGKFVPNSFYIKFLRLAERKNLDTSFLKKVCGKDRI